MGTGTGTWITCGVLLSEEFEEGSVLGTGDGVATLEEGLLHRMFHTHNSIQNQ
jgi:hypothetical protein